MASYYWIKLYHEILDDPKMGRMPAELFRRAIELFLVAGEYRHGGDLPAMTDIAWRLRADEGELAAQMVELEALAILCRNADGGWRVVHFAKRQAPSPAMERMSRSREKARAEYFQDKNIRYEDVTIRNTDTDKEEEKELKADGDGSALLEQGSEYSSFSGLTPQNSAHLRPLPMQRSSDIPEHSSIKLLKRRGLEEQAQRSTTCNPDDVLVKVFMERTGLPLFMGGEEKWAQALERMHAAGVDEEDLEQAIDECRTRGLTIASLASVVNPAIIAMSRRKAGRPEEDYRRYLKGEYGEFGR